MKVAPGYTACCNASPVWRGISDAKLLWSRKASPPMKLNAQARQSLIPVCVVVTFV